MQTNGVNKETQAAIWNGASGKAWVEMQDLLEQTLKPIGELLLQSVLTSKPSRVLDVGCGAGSTTLACAKRFGAGSSCVGIDISEPLIEAARAQAQREHSPATFILDDAATHPFLSNEFELIISRFGVMFFDDPVRAFANLHRAAAPHAELRLMVWRSMEENPFMTTAERAARALLPDIPVREPDLPGQFALANRDRVERILHESNWSDIAIASVDVDCSFPASELRRYVSHLGPLARVLQELNEQTRAKVLDEVVAAFTPYISGSEVRYNAACWMVSATSSSS